VDSCRRGGGSPDNLVSGISRRKEKNAAVITAPDVLIYNNRIGINPALVEGGVFE